MRGGKLSEKLALAASLVAAGCGAAGCSGDHHVSPWGGQPGPSLAAFVRPPDLAAQLALVDSETTSLRLSLSDEIPFELPPKGSGKRGVLRGYRGRDATGREVHAVRVATPRSVVLALGPLDAGDLDRSLATELVPSLTIGDASALALASGTDLNGDGSPDVVLRSEAGALSIWRILEVGSGAYDIAMAAPPTRAVDLDGSGRFALWGQLASVAGDPIAPALTDVATFDGKRYADVTPEARAWHAREAERRPAAGADDAVRARAALERAWHALLAGRDRDAVFAELGRESTPRSLATSFELDRRRIVALTAH